MFIDFATLLRVGLLVAGIWWCKEVLGRLREDISRVREKGVDAVQKGVVIGVWVVTAVIIVAIVLFFVGIIAHQIRAINHPVGG